VLPEAGIEYTNCGDYLMTKGIFSDCKSFDHGGNIYRFAEELKIQERKVIDFSSSVNPLGVSKKVKAEIRKHLKYLNSYPDPEAKRLRKKLAQYHGIDPETILCGNGSTELIYLVVRTLKPQRILIPTPTFSEYERAILLQNTPPPPHPLPQGEGDSLKIPSPSRGEGKGGGESQRSGIWEPGSIKYFMLDKENGFKIIPERFIEMMKNEGSLVSRHSEPVGESLNTSCDMAFLCNPNNPTGRLLKGEDIRKIADAAKEFKCYLIVDEAFIDFCADDSVIEDVGKNPYLIVLRSMTAFYALSGLRLGYGVFPQRLIDRLKAYKEPWTVNNLSQRAAVAAFKDKFYRSETLRLIKEEKRFLEKSFEKIGIEFFGSDVNFYLLKTSSAHEISRQLKTRGILVRDCANFRGLDSTYLRVAVKSHKENAILIKELTSILDKRNNEENKNR
jgi:threonine-phosphate decarboxylase